MKGNMNIDINVRSQVTPSNPVKDFHIGMTFPYTVALGCTVEKVLESLFPENRWHVAFVVINGSVCKDTQKVLQDGDLLHIIGRIGNG